MDVCKRFCDGGRKFVFEIKEGVSCLVWKYFDLLGSQHLFEILETIVKNSENVAKSGCFGKPLRWRAPILFQNDGNI